MYKNYITLALVVLLLVGCCAKTNDTYLVVQRTNVRVTDTDGSYSVEEHYVFQHGSATVKAQCRGTADDQNHVRWSCEAAVGSKMNLHPLNNGTGLLEGNAPSGGHVYFYVESETNH